MAFCFSELFRVRTKDRRKDERCYMFCNTLRKLRHTKIPCIKSSYTFAAFLDKGQRTFVNRP